MADVTILVTETPDGPLWQVTIGTGPLRAWLTNAGAALVDLRHAGVAGPLILGYSDPESYLANPDYCGALVGRVANRIAGASAVIAGERHHFDVNEGDLTLHGGRQGTSHCLWRLEDCDAETARFALTLPDGHMGFPGTLFITAVYRVEGEGLSLVVTAGTDRETLCNIASHCYYACSPETRLTVPAEHYQPVTLGVPDGDPAPVEGTCFDYRAGQPITAPIDHNLCLARHRGALRPVAMLTHSGHRIEIASTEPGLQVYDGRHLDIAGGLEGRHYRAYEGVALEPQAWVDAPNRAWADQVVLRPGETYRQETRITVETT